MIFGVLGTTLACNVARIGNLLEIWNKVINAFTGPLFGIFVLAMFSQRASSGAVLLGGLAGAGVTYYVAYGSSIGFLWPSTFGLAATLLVGLTVAQVRPSREMAGRNLTWRAVVG